MKSIPFHLVLATSPNCLFPSFSSLTSFTLHMAMGKGKEADMKAAALLATAHARLDQVPDPVYQDLSQRRACAPGWAGTNPSLGLYTTQGGRERLFLLLQDVRLCLQTSWCPCLYLTEDMKIMWPTHRQELRWEGEWPRALCSSRWWVCGPTSIMVISTVMTPPGSCFQVSG